MRYKIYYPSGMKVVLSGDLRILGDPDIGTAPYILGEDKLVVGLDPRAVCIDELGVVQYNPRDYVSQMSNTMREWMEDHPEWPETKGRGGN